MDRVDRVDMSLVERQKTGSVGLSKWGSDGRRYFGAHG